MWMQLAVDAVRTKTWRKTEIHKKHSQGRHPQKLTKRVVKRICRRRYAKDAGLTK